MCTRRSMLSIVVLAVVLIPQYGNATLLTIETNTDTLLEGSFSVDDLLDPGQTFTIAAGGGAFGDLFPGSDPRFFISRRLDGAGFATFQISDPIDAAVNLGTGEQLATFSGTFDNNSTSTLVHFLFYDLVNPGSLDDPFTGKFKFSTSPVPLPATVWLFVSALGGLVGLRRYRGAQCAGH
ncbi:MAG: VPLPA-CTERM sorting domain-containing protein [Pseudomonadota bacterium]